MVWDLFSNFTIEKIRTVLFWSPLKDTQTVSGQAKNDKYDYMNRKNLNAVHDKDLIPLLSKLGLADKMKEGKLKCKFTGTQITFDNLYSIFPESGDIKVVCDKPEAIKLFTDYVNERKL